MWCVGLRVCVCGGGGGAGRGGAGLRVSEKSILCLTGQGWRVRGVVCVYLCACVCGGGGEGGPFQACLGKNGKRKNIHSCWIKISYIPP